MGRPKTKVACEHGIEGGCEVVCQNCGHTCKRHVNDEGECDKSSSNWECGCSEYKSTEG